MTIILSDLVNPIAPPEDKVAVQANSVTLSSKVTNLNFTGAGVTATNVGGAVTVNVPGGGGSIAVKSEGTTLTSAATSIDFKGSKTTNLNGAVTVEADPPSKTIHQVSHGFTVGRCLTLQNDGTYVQASDSSKFGGIVTSVIDSDNYILTTRGEFTNANLTEENTEYFVNSNGVLVPILYEYEEALYSDIGVCVSVVKSTTTSNGYIITDLVEKPVNHYVAAGNAFITIASLPVQQTLCYITGNGNVALASALSETTLADCVSLSTESTFSKFLCVKLQSFNPDVYNGLRYSAAFPTIDLVAADGTKVYLSETPGAVTLTPPTIKQVVGVVRSNKVEWVTSYRVIGSVGGPLTVKEEGVNATTAATSINFTGAYSAVSSTGGDVTVNIGTLEQTVNQAAHGFVVGNVVRHNVPWELATNQDWSENQNRHCGIVTKVIDVNNFEVAVSGYVSGPCLDGLSALTTYYIDDDNPGTLIDTANLTGIQRADVIRGDKPPFLRTYLSGEAALLHPGKLSNTDTTYVVISGATTTTPELWVLDNDVLVKAIANNESSLATHITCLTIDNGYGAATPLHTLTGAIGNIAPSFGLNGSPQSILLTGTDGQNVYLSSTVAGGVTLTPPSIRQVVGHLDVDGYVRWCVPYRETTPKITVATSAPSTPAVGDIWVDIS